MTPTSTVVTAVQLPNVHQATPAMMTVVTAPETGTCATCVRVWDLDDLFPDGDGDPMCVDCHRSDTSAEDYAAYRSYMSGR